MNNFYKHPTSIIEKNVSIGNKSKIWHFTHIMKNVCIGNNCIIGKNVFIGENVKIGNNCKIQNNVSIFDGVVLKDDIFCGPSCVFTNVKNPRAFIEQKNKFLNTIIQSGVTIGANSTIVCGNTVSEYAFIGAGSVVTKNIQKFALVYGNPAKKVGWVSKNGCKLDNSLTCPRDNSQYVLKNNQLELK